MSHPRNATTGTARNGAVGGPRGRRRSRQGARPGVPAVPRAAGEQPFGSAPRATARNVTAPPHADHDSRHLRTHGTAGVGHPSTVPESRGLRAIQPCPASSPQHRTAVGAIVTCTSGTVAFQRVLILHSPPHPPCELRSFRG